MRYLVVAMMLAAAVAFAGDVPDYGVYESTKTQMRNTGGGYSGMGSPVTCRVIYAPDATMVGLRWDYNGDGLQDEDLELYRHDVTEEGLIWQEGEILYVLYKEDSGPWLMMIFDNGETWAIKMERIGSGS